MIVMKPHKKLNQLRTKIDQTDRQIQKLLQKRMQIVLQIARCKKQAHLSVRQPERARQLKLSWKKRAVRVGVSQKFMSSMYDLIHAESVRAQRKLKSAR